MPKGNIKRRCLLLAGLMICFSFLVHPGYGQQVQTITDKKDILIGEQFRIKFRADFATGSCMATWPALPDSIPHFDIIDKGKLDSVQESGNTVLEQTIILTSFDSGRWTFPSFPVNLNPVRDDTTFHLLTDSLAINVSYSPADTSSQLRDIKPLMQVSVTNYTWYYVIGGALLLLLVLFLVYRYFKRGRKERPSAPVSKLSPFDEAMKALNELGQLDLQDGPSVKLYHTRLADIFRQYLSRKQQKSLLTKTTSDILVRMSEHGMPAGHISDLATALRCTDAVKFAKYLPDTIESQDCLQRIKATIDLVEHQNTTIKQ